MTQPEAELQESPSSAGHVFVLRGDLTTLSCDALLVPVDDAWRVVARFWGSLVPTGRLGPTQAQGWAEVQVDEPDAPWADLGTDADERLVRAIVTVGLGWNAAEVAQRAADAVTALRGLQPRHGRVTALVALPLVGTGDGGFARTRGALIKNLLPALRRAAQEAGVDVALVTNDDRDHQALQSQRSDQDWALLPRDLRDAADELGRRAGGRELSLFLGAGVSVPLGAPSWKELLQALRRRLPADARVPVNDDPVAEATALERALEPGVVGAVVAEQFDYRLTSPGHVLLAALEAERTVTTNYDRAFEIALSGSQRTPNHRVLAGELPEQPAPWVLKLHGDVDLPETVVLTESGYARLESELGALLGVVESLLHTGHLLFVGYSLTDPTFLRAAERVASVRRLADPQLDVPFATVLALRQGDISERRGVRVVPMLQEGEIAPAARLLEIFLDRMAWAAAHERGVTGYLLDDRYTDLRDEDDPELVRRLRLLVPFASGTGVGADRLRRLLAAFGHDGKPL